ncbi:ABC-three component system protein [Pseudomonas sp. NPDC087336]|uniref:ABC-three component system protein n=1 Tax=Pseudomonas sp. NPDC087336 TaxID=3364436 RepID=UPI003825271D
MPELNFEFLDNYTSVQINCALRPTNGLNLCLLQLPATINEALNDHSRPAALNVLRNLLEAHPDGTGPALSTIAPAGDPVLIVAPEWALGSVDWSTVDALVRATNRSLVLITGFGLSLGQAVLQWCEASSEDGTARHLAWDQTRNGISPVMRVNGGWCWIHEPNGQTHCITYLKNALQQSYEAVQLDDVQPHDTLLHLRFNDLDLFPLICADLLRPAGQSQNSPQARIRRKLESLNNDRPALIVGSLLQTGYNQNWGIAIDSLLNYVLAGRQGIVALCNVAHDVPVADESNDKWRSLSGVFASLTEMPHGQKNLPAARSLNAQGIVGAVVRGTYPSVTAGIVHWPPYNPVNSLLIWRGNMVCLIQSTGMMLPVTSVPNKVTYEIERFLRRYPPATDAAPRLSTGIAEIGAHLHTNPLADSSAILNAILEGTDFNKKVDPDAIADPEVISALRAGLHALATLKSIDGIDWQDSTSATGQLIVRSQNRHLLIWRSHKESPRALKRILGEWRDSGGPHPHLVVLGATPHGDLADGEFHPERRDDFSTSPNGNTDLRAGGSLAPVLGDIGGLRGMRRVAGLGLSKAAAVYADYVASEDDERVEELLDQIASLFRD